VDDDDNNGNGRSEDDQGSSSSWSANAWSRAMSFMSTITCERGTSWKHDFFHATRQPSRLERVAAAAAALAPPPAAKLVEMAAAVAIDPAEAV
jgi:hypothetical protein